MSTKSIQAGKTKKRNEKKKDGDKDSFCKFKTKAGETSGIIELKTSGALRLKKETF